MSRIDELQRLHEAAEKVLHDETFDAYDLRADIHRVELRISWPAIHRVLVAARKFSQECDFHVRELDEALRALDGGA